MIPFPNEDVTPPVTKIYFALAISLTKLLFNLWGSKVLEYDG